MYDVVKSSISEREKKVTRRNLRRWMYLIGAVLCLILVMAALKVIGAAIMILVIAAVTLLAFFFGSLALLFFRSRRTTAGAVFAVLSLFFVLADVKSLQFYKMGSTPQMMPATTVSTFFTV